MQTLNFFFNNTELKIYGTVQDPIFVINDICKIIGIKKKSDLIKRVKKDEFFRGQFQTYPEIPCYKCQQLAVINEFGLYEILYRSDSQIAAQFRLEASKWLKQQRLQQNILMQQKILEQESLKQEFKIEKQQLNQKIIDQQIQHEQELENKEHIYFVMTIHKVDYDFDPEDDEEDFDITSSPQRICVSKNPQQIFNNYIIKLNKHYKQELNYHFVILQNRMKREQAFQFKSDYLTNVFGCCKTQHNSEQSVTPLFE